MNIMKIGIVTSDAYRNIGIKLGTMGRVNTAPNVISNNGFAIFYPLHIKTFPHGVLIPIQYIQIIE